ncbi:aspartate carbamoyltransferase catalytic subunit [Nakamurella aerolata]|uniref:Aspartate carbamoyltransferase n=1 Tax=Nakamurella aerolata TaxID=1656892 RepID=A0A849A9U7_9ACTN|nr:aspartate carbamoyltransferase catalytic subunit [Nakamurella aerolata]NNG37309.1 aspartate carbamoyltransferase catalytic subunit [Nakamurella aerolata]
MTAAPTTARHSDAAAGSGLPRHLLDTRTLSADAAELILDTAAQIEQAGAGRQIRKLPTLRGRTVVNLFFEDSTRTRSSFELAGKLLSADVINISGKGSSVSKGESLRDTVATVDAMGVDAIVLRHKASGAAARVAGWVDATVINAGDGTHEHPTQALLDAYVMRRRLGTLAGRTVTIVGDVLHSRVARSNIWLLNTLGADVRLVCPPTLVPAGVENWPVQLGHDLDQALDGADVAMMLRVQAERMTSGYFPSAAEYSRLYGLNERRRRLLRPDGIVMHPGPMNRGMEIAPATADAANSVILDQVAAGVNIRMAVLYLMAGSGPATADAQPSDAAPAAATETETA